MINPRNHQSQKQNAYPITRDWICVIMLPAILIWIKRIML